jgi:hypothetical protein
VTPGAPERVICRSQCKKIIVLSALIVFFAMHWYRENVGGGRGLLVALLG